MTADLVFDLATRGVVPGWLLLVFLPRWRWSARLVCSVLIPALLGGLYLVLIVRWFGAGDGGFGSLAGVSAFFEEPWLLLAGWIHYLAFDLFVGAWEARDAQRIGLHHMLVVPCLLLTFLFGPIGLLLYLVLRAVVKKRVWVDDGEAPA